MFFRKSLFRSDSFIEGVISDSVCIIESIVKNRKVEKNLLERYLFKKSTVLKSEYLNLFSTVRSLYLLFKTHKIKPDNEILFLLSEILDCFILVKNKKYKLLELKISTLEKTLSMMKKENNIEKDFLKKIKFDKIYSEIEKLLFIFIEISEKKEEL